MPDQSGLVFARVVARRLKAGADVELGPATAIVSADNRVGKSTVLTAIELLLTGRYAGGERPSDLMDLSSDGSGFEVLGYADAGDSESAASFRLSTDVDGKVVKEWKPPAFIQAAGEDPRPIVPLSQIAEMLAYGTKRAREMVFRQFGAAITLDSPLGLNTAQKLIWEKGVAEVARDLVTADTLSDLAKHFRSEARKASATAKTSAATLVEYRAQLAGLQVSSERDEEDKRQKYELARRWYDGEGLRDRRQQLQSELNGLSTQLQALGLEPELNGLRERLSAAQASLVAHGAASGDSGGGAQSALLAAAKDALQAVLARPSVTKCPCCGGALERERAEERLAKIEAAVQAAGASASWGAKRAALAREVSGLEAALNRAVSEHAGKRTAIKERGRAVKARLDEVEAAIKEQGAAQNPGIPLDRAKAEWESCRNRYERRQQLTQQIELLSKAKGDHNDVRVVAQEFDVMLQGYLKAAREAAETAVNAGMPKGYKASLALTDANGADICEWCVVGADGRPHNRHAMSGSELAALTVAYALAMARAAGDTPKVLLLDDRELGMFAPARLTAFLSAVAKAVSSGQIEQAVACWTRESEIPKDWTKVRVGASK